MQSTEIERLRTAARVVRGAALAAALGVFASPAVAQQAAAPASVPHAAADSTQRTAEATRAQLEALAAQDEREAQSASDGAVRSQKMAEAAAIRDRLRNGDFQVGDRVALVVRGDSSLSDTVSVRAGRVIQLKGLPDIPLQGVLHSELDGYLEKQLAKYLRNPDVEATSLVRLALLGQVAHPGFYSFPADMTLSDAIMIAGGPTQGGDVNKTVVKRDNKVAFNDKLVQRAFASGTTLDQMNLRAGDEVVVGEKSRHDWLRVLQVVSLGAGVLVSIYALSHR
ncbi:MAG TPA: SLBB domain-containing protein [Gemmatimonadaceae bacterium]|nr:SLBB domain-containing protein [Gemmatimonadaceae bacterium]